MIAANLEGDAGIKAMDQITPTIAREAAPFDYAAMEPATADEAQAVAARYRQRSKAYFMDTGHDLLSMKSRLEHGLFLRWVVAEMALTPRTAQNFMQAAAQLGHKSETVSHLPAGVLYKLAAPSTPAPVRDEIVGRLEAGEALTPKAIDLRLWEARKEAIREKAASKETMEQRARRLKSKRDADARHARSSEEHRQRMVEDDARKKAEAAELAAILAPLLDANAYRRVYDLIHRVYTSELQAALSIAWGKIEAGRRHNSPPLAVMKSFYND